jgi:nifR3 family TIM-barrel protein
MKNFWQKFKKPILALAPMAGITDAPFRYLCGKFGAQVVYSEMISAAGLFYDSERTSGLLDSYKKNGGAKFVVQVFGNNPKHFAKAVKIIEKTCHPDGIDINFGCPVPKVQKVGAGAKLFQDLELSHDVIKACLDNTKLPISVKTRVKAGRVSVLDFIEKMKDLPISALMLHGRTLAGGFTGEIDFALMDQARKKFNGVFLANGAIKDVVSAKEMLKKTGADGLGIGQAVYGQPWIFKQLSNTNYQPSIKEVFKIAFEHAKLMKKLKGPQGVIEMRKHLCWYVKGLPGAAEMRKEFVKIETLSDIKKAFAGFSGKK